MLGKEESLNLITWNKGRFYKKIGHLLTRKEKRSCYALLGYMIVSMLLETASIGMIVPLIHVVSDPGVMESTGLVSELIYFFNINDHYSLMLVSAIVLFLVFLIKNIFLSFVTWYRVHFISTLRMALSNRLFETYLFQPYEFHLKNNSGRLIQNVSNEVTIFTGRLLTPLANLIGEILVLIGIVVLLFVIEPTGTLVVAIFLGIVSAAIIYFTRLRVTRWGNERQFHDGKRIQHLQQGLGGIKDVLWLGREHFFLNKYKEHSQLSTGPDIKQTFLQEIPRYWFEVLAVSGLTLMIIVISLQEKSVATIFSTLAVFAAAAFRLMPSITRILAALQSLRYSLPVLNVLYREFNSNRTRPDNYNLEKSSIKSDSEFADLLALKNITYRYPNSKNISLDSVSLEICYGECIGIIGASGSGKSTLVNLLLGLLSPDSGEVMSDGENIKRNMHNWQKQIGYVPQSIFLTDDSLRNNIAFGIPDDEIDDFLIERAVRLAQLQKLVDTLPEGVETFVGERGVRLSGGQRQRIGIARAIYYDPKIMVFDEATSSLDNNTERQIMKTVHELHKDKTIIIVAHRLTTVRNCNRLYRLENGKIVEQGSPKDMLA